MFEDFQLRVVDTPQGPIRIRIGGEGKPLLLLHGHPRTHMTWGQVADRLVPEFQIICADLPGFGGSYLPADTSDSRLSSKREKARALLAMMQTLGHEAFSVAGHDRGSYTAFRMAMDHPTTVERLVVIDCIPILEHLERVDWRFARDWYHWFFFAQPEKPERAILADPSLWYGNVSPDRMGQEAYDDLVRALKDPAIIHGMVEDYRASLRIDHHHDHADRLAGRKLICPTLCLWSAKDDLEQIHGDPVAIWRAWAENVAGFSIDSGHHVAEENPQALAVAISDFLRSSTG
ncbi:alpha/beta fold hydrolase [Neorhizobium sp. NPDC001467]|uniref:alpha/beta fold hydrolase n=1 Tax=Neorhizobium sp. NPDC001467 TaxID=3390595 RepID=UPI003CFD4580